MMKKIKLTRANKSITLKALAPYYYRERALGHSTQEIGELILKINSLPADKSERARMLTRPILNSTRKTGSSGRNRSLRLPPTQAIREISTLFTL